MPNDPTSAAAREIAPCPKCGSADIRFSNCGYSSFDVATAECRACKHKIIVSCSSDARTDWGRYRDDPAKREFYHWLLSDEGKTRLSPERMIVDAAAETFRKHFPPAPPGDAQQECEFCGDPATRTEQFDRPVPVCDECSAAPPGDGGGE